MDVLRLQRKENDNWENIYLFSLENRPLRTLYCMRDNGLFSEDDFKFHFNLYLQSTKELIENDPVLKKTVRVVCYKDDSDFGKFTQHMFSYLEQAFIV